MAEGNRRADLQGLRALAGGCGESMSRAAIDVELEQVTNAEREAARGLPNVSILDLESVLCSATTCSGRPLHDGSSRYRDEYHLSVLALVRPAHDAGAPDGASQAVAARRYPPS